MSAEAPDPSSLPAVIVAVRDEYAAKGHTPYDIGNGLCDDFARDVLERWVGEDWILREGDGFMTLETLNLIDPETGDWDWPLLAEHWGTTPPTVVTPAKLTEVAFHEPSHVWITVGHRHYDCETPQGVATHFDLPFFRRWMGLERRDDAADATLQIGGITNMLHQIQAGDRSAVLDIEALTTDQGLALASAAAALLMRSGMIAEGAVLTGPHLIQFMGELGDHLAQGREERLLQALDAAHYHVDASEQELADAGRTRSEALARARDLRDEADPIDERDARWERSADIGG